MNNRDTPKTPLPEDLEGSYFMNEEDPWDKAVKRIHVVREHLSKMTGSKISEKWGVYTKDGEKIG